MPVLRSVYRAGGAGANNTYTAHTKKRLNSTLLCVQYIYCWLRLRLRDILLTLGSGAKNGNSIREQYIHLTDRISVLATVMLSERNTPSE
jgi:hypothetical protein